MIIDLVAVLLLLLNLKTVFRFIWQKKFLFFVFLIFINLINSQSRFISLYQYLKIFEFLVIFIIFKKIKLPTKKILTAVIVGGFIQLGLTIWQLIIKGSVQGLFYYLGERYFSLSTPAIAKGSLFGIEFLRPYGSFSHPNSLAGFYLLLYFWVLTSKKFERIKFWKNIFLLLSSLLIFISFSKIAIIVFLILNSAYLILNIKYLCKFCLFAKIFILLVISTIFLQVRSDPLSLEKRVVLIKNALDIIRQNLVFGVGAGSYLVAQNKLIQSYANFLNQPVHNIFLLLAAEWGLMITGLCAYIFMPVFKFIYKKNIWILLVILLTGFFDHYWFSLNQNLMLLAVIFGGL